MAALGMTEAHIQRLVAYLELCLDKVVNPYRYETSNDEEDVVSKCGYPFVASVALHPAGGGYVYAMANLATILCKLAKRSTQGRLQTVFDSANFPSPFKDKMWNSLIHLTLRLCGETGLRHSFDERNHCVRCWNQLCEHLRHTKATYANTPSRHSVSTPHAADQNVQIWIEQQNSDANEYICACGRPAHPNARVSCKICRKDCYLYTLNAFDVIKEDEHMPKITMKSINDVNGGREDKCDGAAIRTLITRRGTPGSM
ncbi:hypothetical protein DL98DRAFT_618734 [Cadophora sp. DSE1049]|nr:hypothetical protein DL98DRAFT_618734 [Cadophora sp. DSE1049]